jgi:hypothetical protein
VRNKLVRRVICCAALCIACSAIPAASASAATRCYAFSESVYSGVSLPDACKFMYRCNGASCLITPGLTVNAFFLKSQGGSVSGRFQALVARAQEVSSLAMTCTASAVRDWHAYCSRTTSPLTLYYHDTLVVVCSARPIPLTALFVDADAYCTLDGV